jgi:hypothetical protein
MIRIKKHSILSKTPSCALYLPIFQDLGLLSPSSLGIVGLLAQASLVMSVKALLHVKKLACP